MSPDAEHLKLLTIFLYVVAGLGALFSFFPLVYTTVGTVFIVAARRGTARPGEELPPEFLGWMGCCAWLGSVLDRNSDGDLHSNDRTIARAPKTILVRFCDGLH